MGGWSLLALRGGGQVEEAVDRDSGWVDEGGRGKKGCVAVLRGGSSKWIEAEWSSDMQVE